MTIKIEIEAGKPELEVSHPELQAVKSISEVNVLVQAMFEQIQLYLSSVCPSEIDSMLNFHRLAEFEATLKETFATAFCPQSQGLLVLFEYLWEKGFTKKWADDGRSSVLFKVKHVCLTSTDRNGLPLLIEVGFLQVQ